MTNEQREILAKIAELNFLLEGQAKEEYSPVLQEALSLIKEQEEEIEKYKRMITEHKKQLKQSGIYGYDYDLKID